MQTYRLPPALYEEFEEMLEAPATKDHEEQLRKLLEGPTVFDKKK